MKIFACVSAILTSLYPCAMGSRSLTLREKGFDWAGRLALILFARYLGAVERSSMLERIAEEQRWSKWECRPMMGVQMFSSHRTPHHIKPLNKEQNSTLNWAMIGMCAKRAQGSFEIWFKLIRLLSNGHTPGASRGTVPTSNNSPCWNVYHLCSVENETSHGFLREGKLARMLLKYPSSTSCYISTFRELWKPC